MGLKNQLGVVLIVSVLWGCDEIPSKKQKSNDSQENPKQEQKQMPEEDAAPSGEADEYGREPGDEHYGHDHPPADQQQQIPQQNNPMFLQEEQGEAKSGEADKYGRMPGDEHYGHDHPPQDEQQNNPIKKQQGNTSGETDDYGRKPGDEHYGHDHP